MAVKLNEMEKKITAVEWLVEQMKKPYADKHIMDILDQAKQLEKQQIVDAYNNGQQIPPFEYAEQYYSETYQSTEPI